MAPICSPYFLPPHSFCLPKRGRPAGERGRRGREGEERKGIGHLGQPDRRSPSETIEPERRLFVGLGVSGGFPWGFPIGPPRQLTCTAPARLVELQIPGHSPSRHVLGLHATCPLEHVRRTPSLQSTRDSGDSRDVRPDPNCTGRHPVANTRFDLAPPSGSFLAQVSMRAWARWSSRSGRGSEVTDRCPTGHI
ncbi:hypothetical protein GQ53DRAFT_224028 [Thozetella sp. PMI_491]|nr:hypothetical protein GQ53DRAFT_224028 [Thozetella sp. PMI_491]